MKVTEAASLSEILRGRREFIARSWYEAVVCTSFVPFTEADLFNCLLDLTDQTIDTFLAEPFVPAQAQAIGTNLAELHCIGAEALGGAQEVLATRLPANLPGDTVTRLQPRLVGLLSATDRVHRQIAQDSPGRTGGDPAGIIDSAASGGGVASRERGTLSGDL